MSRPRLAAARVLWQVTRGQSTLAAALERARQPFTDRRDRALVGEITTGALRWRNELDALISAASRRRISQIDERALAVLRLAVYQLRHLERVPAHAIVHESVEVTRELGASRAAAFVNAVLRGLLRDDRAAALPARPAPGSASEEAVAYLSVTLSHPAWLARRWLARYGFDATEQWCLFNNTPPDVTVRSAGRLTAAELLAHLQDGGIPAQSAPYVSDAIRLPRGTLGQVAPQWRDELFVQDEGAQLIARAAAARPGERILDVCAAPGGKTLVLGADLRLREQPGQSLLVAGDRRRARVSLLGETLRRVHLPAAIVGLDALRPLPFARGFDCVLLDAPCSGLGTLRRDPDLKWSRVEAELPRLAADQRRMALNAAALVRPGGRLVYATCSSEPEENEAVVESVLAETGAFTRAPLVPGPGLPAAVIDPDGCLVTTPVRHGLEAFFAAVLVRQAAA